MAEAAAPDERVKTTSPLRRALIRPELGGMCGTVLVFVFFALTAADSGMFNSQGVLNWSTVWQTEFITYMMVAATLIGLPYVQKLRGHVNVDLLPLLLPHRARRVLFFLVTGLGLAVVALMFFYGAEMWWTATSRGWTSDTVWGVRLTFPYFAVPLGFGLFLLQLIADMLAVSSRREEPFGLAADEGLTTAVREGH